MIIMMLSNWMQEQVTFLLTRAAQSPGPGCKLGSSASYCKSGLLKQQQEQRGYSTLTEIFLAMKFFTKTKSSNWSNLHLGLVVKGNCSFCLQFVNKSISSWYNVAGESELHWIIVNLVGNILNNSNHYVIIMEATKNYEINSHYIFRTIAGWWYEVKYWADLFVTKTTNKVSLSWVNITPLTRTDICGIFK